MIESKALARVAVRIICLVSPLRLSTGASTPCQDSMKLHRPKWEHPPWRQGATEKWRVYCLQFSNSLNQSASQWWSRLGVGVFCSWQTHIVTCWLCDCPSNHKDALCCGISVPVTITMKKPLTLLENKTRSHPVWYSITFCQDAVPESEAGFSNLN